MITKGFFIEVNPGKEDYKVNGRRKGVQKG